MACELTTGFTLGASKVSVGSKKYLLLTTLFRVALILCQL